MRISLTYRLFMSCLLSSGVLPPIGFATSGILLKLHEVLQKAHDPWTIIGICGSFVFSIRFVLQWIASERVKKSVIPFGFWECSVIGSVLVLSHFVYEKDIVGILQNILPLPIYLRNVYLRAAHKTPKHPGNEPRPAE